MGSDSANEERSSDVLWLGEVREVRQPLSGPRPIWMRQSLMRSGPPPPQPTVPYPERHPYCEFNVGLQGHAIQYIGREKLDRRAGSVMLLGPGIPHTAELFDYPQKAVTAYFLPVVLFEMGPEGDGARILSRFTTEQSIQERIVRPPVAVWRRIERSSAEMLTEFQRGGFGSELRLRSLLMEMLVALLRWEESEGKRVVPQLASMYWDHVQRALHFLQEHYAEPVYVQEVARAAGLSANRLQKMFHEALGMSCVEYLTAYRISHAMALLGTPGCRVTEVALSVGFETLSHFNTTFHRQMGMSPTEYIKSLSKTGIKSRKTG